MIYFCCTDDRRAEIEKSPNDVNGIDFIEVSEDQRHLFIRFIKPDHVAGLTKDNFRIEGGERIRDVRVISVSQGIGSLIDPNTLTLEVNSPGDFSIYTLRIVRGGTSADRDRPPQGFDPLLSETEFEFKAACETDFDCGHKVPCPRDPKPAPAIDYLAKDYASFRQLLLDRMAVLIPEWRERHAADLNVTLIELLSYVGDYLSYQQDAIATEAYLGTARRRVSVRRHARLVDYPMHDGANARVWVRLTVGAAITLPLRKNALTRFLTRVSISGGTLPLRIDDGTRDFEDALSAGAKVFELIDAPELLALEPDHNEMQFHTWKAQECCLPRGATTADLKGNLPNLKNRIVVFAEVKGARTGDPRDADRTHRHAVRVVSVKAIFDPLEGIDVTRIEWPDEDALPFPICVSSKNNVGGLEDNVSVAWGNIVLADHGRTITDVELGPVPRVNDAIVAISDTDRCEDEKSDPPAARFTPMLPDRDITFDAPYDIAHPDVPASELLEMTPRQLAPGNMKLVEKSTAAREWVPREHLLNANNSDLHFVVENETDGSAFLRFGDGIAGAVPGPDTTFIATYRVGHGSDGNIGGDSIASIVSDAPQTAHVTSVTNPMPARGGVEPESMERVRQNAPAAFRTQKRAVTAADYATMAQSCSKDVQRAAATFRWTGSWNTVFVTVDRKSGRDVGEEKFRAPLERCLNRYRMAGHDLRFDLPRFVPLEVALTVCVKRDYFTSDVANALREVLGTSTFLDGRRGFFHPDNFTFAQPLYLSRLLATAQAVEGVDSVEITTLHRQGKPNRVALDEGSLAVGPLEIVQLENDTNFRERGVLTLDMRGGR